MDTWNTIHLVMLYPGVQNAVVQQVVGTDRLRRINQLLAVVMLLFPSHAPDKHSTRHVGHFIKMNIIVTNWRISMLGYQL